MYEDIVVFRHRQVNHARNLWDRAITILPRANQFWYKYSYMEEMLGNMAGNVRVHERYARAVAYQAKFLYMKEMFCNAAGKYSIVERRCNRQVHVLRHRMESRCLNDANVVLLQVRGRCLSAGWSGNRRSRPGIRISTSRCATRNYSAREPYTNAISFCVQLLALYMNAVVSATYICLLCPIFILY